MPVPIIRHGDANLKPPPWKQRKRPGGPPPRPPSTVSTPATLETNIEGTVESIVFRVDDTGYTVCSVTIPNRKDTITVVGTCPVIWVGETLKAQGHWVRHRQHGYQFQADNLSCIAPTSKEGIQRFLASGLIRGVGKVTAERIVKMFGVDTLRIIEHESRRLEEVEGIGASRRQTIKESWNTQRHIRDIMIFMQSHGVGTAQSARINRQYGDKAIQLISENPYRLCREIWGIGFLTADRVAQSIGIPPQSIIRARAGMVYVLQSLTDEGHCFCLGPELLLKAESLLNIPVEILAPALENEIQSGALVRDNDRIYIERLHRAETGVAQRIHDLLTALPGFQPIAIHKAIPWAQERMHLSFAPRQQAAIEMALQNKVCIITGGPGVGKTTIIRALVDIFQARQLKVALAAPTGRAAKRMEEATRQPSLTLHRLLKFVPGMGRFTHDRSTPLDQDILIIDEMSMVDIELMQAFLQAVPDRAHLVLVGDTDQLPSVGPGNVLHDLIQSDVIPNCRLETIFRQEAGGWIVQNAHGINHGEFFNLPPDGADSDFFFLETETPEAMIERMLSLVRDRIPARFKLDPHTDIQVLTPMRKNELGADNLNRVLQAALNPDGPGIERFGRIYRAGDRVMQIRNNYDKAIFNGDIGRIQHVEPEANTLVVNFDGNPVPYDASELDELVLAYACSIHKSQGSEYPAVVILIATQHFKLLQRNLLYTAVTRGRNLVCVVGSRKAIHIAIGNNEIRMRRTALAQRIAALNQPA